MITLIPTRNIPYRVNVETPSGDVHLYTPDGVINVDDADAEWLINTGDWQRAGEDFKPAKRNPALLDENGLVITEPVEITDGDLEPPDVPDYTDYTKSEWLALAEDYGIEVDASASKQVIYDTIIGELYGA